MSGRTGRIRLFRLGAAVLSTLLLLASAGCFGSRRADVPPAEPERTGPSDNTAGAVSGVFPPVIPIIEEPAPAAKAGTPEVKAETPAVAAATPVPAAEEREKPKAAELPQGKTSPESPAPRALPEAEPSKKPRASAAQEPPAPPAATAALPRPEGPPVPVWARQNESLAYRVDFLGITMGYARFLYKGRVTIGGRTAYHVNVRAWTTGVLSFLYPINETIEYYLDSETIAPIRIEYTGRKNKRDDVAVYDQENGKIVYRYRDNGQIRKKVDVLPLTHDPVSAAYYFRWRDMGREDKPKNVYGGRKVYQIATRIARSERLKTDRGEVDTLAIEPLIRRDGKAENKGDLRMWVTDDERRVPVRLYGKFRKVKEWTLYGELMP